jgi:hypothetical protein
MLLVLAIAPGVMEMLELAVHWAKYGDVADAGDDQHKPTPLGDDEHGCSGTFHLGHCGSAQSAQVNPPIAIETTILRPEIQRPIPAAFEPQGRRSSVPPFRPPIA